MKRMVVGFCIVAVTLMPAYGRATGEPSAQAACALTEANSPAVRGIRLGMGVDQLAALFPGSSKRREIRDALDRAKASNGNELVTLIFDPAMDGGGDRFAGVVSVSARVHGGHVVAFNVFYAGTAWGSIDEWVGKLAEAYGLPTAARWVAGPSESPNKVLACNGIEVEAALQGGGSSIAVRNAAQIKGADDRTNAAEERKRREFKP